MTITSLSQSNPSRWGEFSCTRPAVEPRESTSKPLDKTERAEAERDGPRRSPLFSAVKEALAELFVRTETPAAPESTESTAADTSADTSTDNDELEQAIADFASALMHALREGRGPHGEGRGRHLGHAYGRDGWSDAAQRVEQLAREFAPKTTEAAPATEAPAVKAPVEPPVEAAAAEVPAAQAEATPTTTTTSAAPTTTASAPTLSVRLTLDLTLTDSPWKSAHDGLVESFAEVQRAVGRADTDSDEQSLEERMQEMLVALAAKLRSQALHTAALAPAGSLLSVVA